MKRAVTAKVIARFNVNIEGSDENEAAKKIIEYYES